MIQAACGISGTLSRQLRRLIKKHSMSRPFRSPKQKPPPPPFASDFNTAKPRKHPPRLHIPPYRLKISRHTLSKDLPYLVSRHTDPPQTYILPCPYWHPFPPTFNTILAVSKNPPKLPVATPTMKPSIKLQQ